MNDWYDYGLTWFADYYLLSTLLLGVVLLVGTSMRQPARRLALAWATVAGLMLLGGLLAVPGWSVVHVLGSPPPRPAQPQGRIALESPTSAPVSRTTDFESIPTYVPPAEVLEEAREHTQVVTPVRATVREVNLSPYFLLPLLVGSSAVFGWLALGAWQTYRLVRHSSPPPPEVDSLLAVLSAPGDLRPLVRLSRLVATGVALGLIRPTILLPQVYADQQDAAALRSVLAHELAHLRHGDLWLLAVLRALMIVLWAQPLYWLFRRRVRLDQETLADAASAELTSRTTYAEQLVGWARQLDTVRPPSLAGAVGLWETKSQLRKRIAVLLDERLMILRNCSRGWKLAALTVCGGVALGLSLLTVEPGEAVAEEVAGKQATKKLHSVVVHHPGQIVHLIAGGAKVNETDDEGVTPLWKAVRFSKPGSVRLLLDANADPSITDEEQGWTPLHCNAFCNSEPDSLTIAQLLLEHGANVDATEPTYGETSLHYAVRVAKSVELTRQLVESKANVNARSSKGDTPLQFAVGVGEPEIANLLLGHGADPELRNDAGFRPIDQINAITAETAQEIQAVFRRHGADDQRRPEIFKKHRKQRAETPARVIGKIVLEDGSPADVKGQMYYDTRNANGNGASGTEEQYVDRFAFSVGAGTTWLTYYAEGYAPVWTDKIELAPGEVLDDIQLLLKPGISEVVRVTDEEGQPIAGATVVAHPEIHGMCQGPIFKHTTDDKGEVLLQHLASTRYQLKITAPGYQPLQTAPLRVESGEILRPTMVRSNPTEGIIRFADGTPAPNTKLRAIREWRKDGKGAAFGSEGKGFWGTTLATTDSRGRFRLDQLSDGSQYLFVIESVDGVRAVVDNLHAGQEEAQIVLPQRQDLVVYVKGDISKLPQRKGKPFISIRQPIKAVRPGGSTFGELVGEDATLEEVEGGGRVIFRGLAIDLREDAPKQTVRVSLGYDREMHQTVDINPDGGTVVQFEIPNDTEEDTQTAAQEGHRLQILPARKLTETNDISDARNLTPERLIEWSPDEKSTEWFLLDADQSPLFTDRDVESAQVKPAEGGKDWHDVAITLTENAGKRMRARTSELLEDGVDPSLRLVTLLDNKVLLAPRLMSVISQECELTGIRSREQAQVLNEVLGAGSARVIDISFADLAFDIQKGKELSLEMVPEKIRKLSGEQVRIRGFMMPTQNKKGNTSFVLVRDNQEEFPLPIYDNILVTLNEGKTADFTVRPIAVTGRFSVTNKTFVRSDKRLLSTYAIEASGITAKRNGRQGQVVWGKAVDGLRLRLRPHKHIIEDDEREITIELDAENTGDDQQLLPQGWGWLEVDGKWYYRLPDSGLAKLLEIEPGQKHQTVMSITLRRGKNERWLGGWPTPKGGKSALPATLVLQPGRHTLRVALHPADGTLSLTPKPETLACSNPVTLEIAGDDENQVNWGEAVDGVRVRIHSPEIRRDQDQWIVLLKTDLQASKPRILPFYGAPIDEYVIQWDGKWYRQIDRSAKFAASVRPSQALQRDSMHTRIAAKRWVEESTGKPMPKLTSGKHTLRIGYPLIDSPEVEGRGPLRAISNLLEIGINARDSVAQPGWYLMHSVTGKDVEGGFIDFSGGILIGKDGSINLTGLLPPLARIDVAGKTLDELIPIVQDRYQRGYELREKPKVTLWLKPGKKNSRDKIDHALSVAGNHQQAGTIRGEVIGDFGPYRVAIEHKLHRDASLLPSQLVDSGETFEFTGVPIGNYTVTAKPTLVINLGKYEQAILSKEVAVGDGQTVEALLRDPNHNSIPGLSARLRLVSPEEPVRIGDLLQYELVIKNETDEPIEFDWVTGSMWQPVVDQQAQRIKLMGMFAGSGHAEMQHVVVPANQEKVLHHIRHRVQTKDSTTGGLPLPLTVDAGAYQVTAVGVWGSTPQMNLTILPAARLQFRMQMPEGAKPREDQADRVTWNDDNGEQETLTLYKEVYLDEDDVLLATLTPDGDSFRIGLDFSKQGAQIMRAITKPAAADGRRVVILLDGKVIAAPVVRSTIANKCAISSLKSREAQQLHQAILTTLTRRLPEINEEHSRSSLPNSIYRVHPEKSDDAQSPKVLMDTFQVRVVDEEGKPVAGAMVKPTGLRAPNDGSWYGWEAGMPNRPDPREYETDENGHLTIDYPKYIEERRPTSVVIVRASHDEFVDDDTELAIDAPSPTIVLKQGGRVEVAAQLADGSQPSERLYVVDARWGTNPWELTAAGKLRSPVVATETNTIRAVYIPEEGPTQFSRPITVTPKLGETRRVEATLRPGSRLVGVLDDNVPRPVTGGHVVAQVEASHGNGWADWAEIQPDGTFIFESLPADPDEVVQLVGICDGYVSTPPGGWTEETTKTAPQTANLGGEVVRHTLTMVPTAKCLVRFTNSEGEPIEGVRAEFVPNVQWTSGGSGIVAHPKFRLRDLLLSGKLPQWHLMGDFPYVAWSDAKGVATFLNLPPDSACMFAATHDDYQLPVFVAGNGRASRFKILSLESGVFAEAEFELEAKGETLLTGDGEVEVDATSSAEPGDPTKLSGVVLGPDGNPLAGVGVDAWTWHPGNETKTDAEGRFELKNFDPNEDVEIEFTKEGYCPSYFVSKKAGTRDWVVRMYNNTWLEGSVIDDRGDPVADVEIRAERGPFENPNGTIGDVTTTTRTNSDGNYRLYLDPDSYTLKLRAHGLVFRQEGVRLAKGQQRTLKIELENGLTFRAKVIDSVTEEPIEGITLWNWRHKGIEGTSGADGLLEIPGMFPGQFEFNVTAKGADRRREWCAGKYARWWSPDAINEHQRKSIRPAEFQRNFDDLEFELKRWKHEMDPVTIVVERCAVVRGRVLDPEGNPVAGATVAPAKTGSGNSLTGDTRFSYRTKKDGTFEARLPASGGVVYNLVAHDGKYGKWRNWANGVGEPFITSPGEEINGVELRLTRGATVRGRLLGGNGKPLAQKRVRAAPVDKFDNRYYHPETRTDADGRFELKFIRPGKHLIQAEPFWLQAEQAPGGTSQPVDLEAGEVIEGIELAPPGAPKGKRLIKLPDGREILVPDPVTQERPRAVAAEDVRLVAAHEGDRSDGEKVFDELPNGIYSARPEDSDEQGTEVKRSDAEGTVVLLHRLTDQFGRIEMKSMANDNTRFRIHLKGAGPFREGDDIGRLALVVDGVYATVWGHSDPDELGRMDLSASVTGAEAARRIAVALGVQPRLRQHLGHRMEVTYEPTKQSFQAGEAVVLKMTIKNTGDVPFSFQDGGKQRGPRNNQFGFTALCNGGQGPEIPDTGDPRHHGGKSVLRTLRKGEAFEKEVDITKWFDLSQPGTYKIDGRFEIELHDPDAEEYFVLWEDVAHGECLVAIEPEQEEHTAQATIVEAEVVDAETGKPVDKFVVLPGTSYMEGFGWQWQPHMITKYQGGQILWPPKGRRGYAKQVLRIEADGYMPLITDEVLKDAPQRDLTIRLKRSAGIVGTVLDPDGEPAVDARVAIAMCRRDVRIAGGSIAFTSLKPNASLRDQWEQPRTAMTDEKGNFALADETAPALLVITHPTGVAMLSLEYVRKNPEVQLEPWGKIEGQVLWGEKPGAGISIVMGARGRRDPTGLQNMLMVNCGGEMTTGDDGRFVFDKVPPGLAQISKQSKPYGEAKMRSLRPIQMINVLPGVPTQMVFGGMGRPVVGKLVGRDDWTGVHIRIAPNAPRPGDMLNKDDPTWPTYSAFLTSEAGKNYVKENVSVNADGIFRIENVPPEHYQLFVSHNVSDEKTERIGYSSFHMDTVQIGKEATPLKLDNINVTPESDSDKKDDEEATATAGEVDEQVGDTPDVDPRRAWKVTGRVRDTSGQPVPDARVRVATGWGTLLGGDTQFTDADGRYELNFGQGIWMHKDSSQFQAAMFWAAKPGYVEASRSGKQEYMDVTWHGDVVDDWKVTRDQVERLHP